MPIGVNSQVDQTQKVVDRDGERVLEITRTRIIRREEIEQAIALCEAEIVRATQRYIEPVEQRKAELEAQLSELLDAREP